MSKEKNINENKYFNKNIIIIIKKDLKFYKNKHQKRDVCNINYAIFSNYLRTIIILNVHI